MAAVTQRFRKSKAFPNRHLADAVVAIAWLAYLSPSRNRKIFRQLRVLSIQRDPGAQSTALCYGRGVEALAHAWGHEHAGLDRRHGRGHVLPAGRGRDGRA